MKPWFDNDPHRFNLELKDLKDADVEVVVDEKLKAQNILRLQLHIAANNPKFALPEGTPDLNLTVVFPDAFPFFRPVVFDEIISLARHYNPVGKNFCLLGRQTDEWEPRTTLAQHLLSQLKTVFLKGQITDAALLARDETEQPEPMSEYYPEGLPKILFAPDGYEIHKDEEAVFRHLGKIKLGISDAGSAIRFAVMQSENEKGEIIDKQPTGITKTFDQTVWGSVYRLPAPPSFSAVEAMQQLKSLLAAKGVKQLYRANEKRLRNGVLVQHVFALNFQEEGENYKREYTGWLFLVVLRIPRKIEGSKNKWSTVDQAFFAKVSRLGQAAISVRTPKLKPMATKTAAVFGLGALGAPSAIEFAKAGVNELRLLDFDIIELGTTVRWPFGISAASLSKTQVLAGFIEQNYPYTKVVIETIKLGDIPVFGKENPTVIPVNEAEIIGRMMKDASLVYDATADYGLMHYLSQQARKFGVPYVSVSATEGAVGGRIMRVVPGKTAGCWMCMRYHERDQTIPQPAAESSGRIQPIGCGDITFTGASFDLLNVVSSGVRLAVSTMCNGEEKGYPSLNWDIGILHLQDEKGNAILPNWEALLLKKHSECPYCNQHE